MPFHPDQSKLASRYLLAQGTEAMVGEDLGQPILTTIDGRQVDPADDTQPADKHVSCSLTGWS